MKPYTVLIPAVFLTIIAFTSPSFAETSTTTTGTVVDKPNWVSQNSAEKLAQHTHGVTTSDHDSHKNLNPLEVGIGIDVGVNQILEKTEKIPGVGKILKPAGFLEHMNLEARKDTLEAERGSIYLVLDLTELK